MQILQFFSHLQSTVYILFSITGINKILASAVHFHFPPLKFLSIFLLVYKEIVKSYRVKGSFAFKSITSYLIISDLKLKFFSQCTIQCIGAALRGRNIQKMVALFCGQKNTTLQVVEGHHNQRRRKMLTLQTKGERDIREKL